MKRKIRAPVVYRIVYACYFDGISFHKRKMTRCTYSDALYVASVIGKINNWFLIDLECYE